MHTIVVFSTHGRVNAGHQFNGAPHFEGVCTRNELPHFISSMRYAYNGNPALGALLAKSCNDAGVATLAHDATRLVLEYGPLVPMRGMNADRQFEVVSVSALCMVHCLHDSARPSGTLRRAIDDHCGGSLAILASGSLTHRFAQSGLAPEYASKMWSPFLEQLDHHGVAMGQRPTGPASATCCPSTPPRAMATASCTTPPCCWARRAGSTTMAGPTW